MPTSDAAGHRAGWIDLAGTQSETAKTGAMPANASMRQDAQHLLCVFGPSKLDRSAGCRRFKSSNLICLVRMVSRNLKPTCREFILRLLLIEDDAMIRNSVCTGLRQDGFIVDWVMDGDAGELALESGVYDLLLLDLGIPRKDGISVLTNLRKKGNRIPVLILTARDALTDRVKGLNAGADDYLVKPFDLEELVARIHALLRRQAGRAESVIKYGDLILNPTTHEVFRAGKLLSVSAREFTLLQTFLDRPGAVLSVPQLEEKMYGWEEEVGSNTVEVYIHSLRKKLGADFIKNVRGVGYMIPRLP
jgi:two-component system, OmpR family, response regulator QseB